MTLFARLQETGTLTFYLLVSFLFVLLQQEFIFQASWLALVPNQHCAFLDWTKCLNVQINVPSPDTLVLAQVSSFPLSVKGTRSNHEVTLAWLLLVAMTMAPAKSHLSSCICRTIWDFTFLRENEDYGAAENPEAYIYKDSRVYTCTIKLPFQSSSGQRRVAGSEERIICLLSVSYCRKQNKSDFSK